MSRVLLSRVMMVLCALVIGAGIVVLGTGTSAYALDDRPPVTILKKGDRALQNGRQGSYCWTFGPDSHGCADYLPSYPAADLVREDSELYVRIFKAERPEEFNLAAYRKVEEHDFPVGNAQDVPFNWRRVARDGRTVAWDATFKVRQPDRHYYLNAFGIWREGDSSWYFHVKTTG